MDSNSAWLSAIFALIALLYTSVENGHPDKSYRTKALSHFHRFTTRQVATNSSHSGTDA